MSGGNAGNAGNLDSLGNRGVFEGGANRRKLAETGGNPSSKRGPPQVGVTPTESTHSGEPATPYRIFVDHTVQEGTLHRHALCRALNDPDSLGPALVGMWVPSPKGHQPMI